MSEKPKYDYVSFLDEDEATKELLRVQMKMLDMQKVIAAHLAVIKSWVVLFGVALVLYFLFTIARLLFV